jgi:hypothetical protein
MSDLERLTTAFQAMNPWARDLLRALAEDYALLFPAPKPAPHLRLVQLERKDASRKKR